MAEIRLDGLSFRYPGNTEDTLTDLQLDVARGEAHALLGSSGAGKSTLLNLLSGLLPVAPGQIYFDDQDVGSQPPWQRRVTQVFQFPVLYEAMTVAENLAFPMRRAPAGQKFERLTDIAERLGIDALLDVRPGRLTLVQKQLVAIGKSLMRPDVSLVLLDEPLTAAEPEYKWQLRQTLKALQRDLGATMVYVTHDQTEALTFADRVSVLHEGRILQTAEPEELLAKPAHEHVGYFVGSPGMNLLDGEISNGLCLISGVPVGRMAVADGPCRIGFRPEWGRLSSTTVPVPGEGSAELPVRIRGTRTLGTDRDQPHGLALAELEGVEIVTRQPLHDMGVALEAGRQDGAGRLWLDPDRLVCFRNGWKVTADE